MKCKNQRIRTHKKQKYGYCTKYKKEVPIFCKCNEIEYKERKSLQKSLQESAELYRKLQRNEKTFIPKRTITKEKNKTQVCNSKEVKVHKTKKMRLKSSELAKLEKNRFSLFSDDSTKCYICDSTYKLTWHEIFRGPNRQNSMKYGLCLKLCLNCHEMYQENKEFNNYWHVQGQIIFEQIYPDLDFIEIFHRNYLP